LAADRLRHDSLLIGCTVSYARRRHEIRWFRVRLPVGVVECLRARNNLGYNPLAGDFGPAYAKGREVTVSNQRLKPARPPVTGRAEHAPRQATARLTLVR